MGDLIEPARSGRAKCRRCGEKLGKGLLRFGEQVPNAFGDGDAYHWFHLLCAAEKRPEKLIAALRATEGDVPERAELEARARTGIENPKLVEVARAERAPTGRARCRHCREKIEKGALRIALEQEDELAMASVAFIHARCAPSRLGRTGLMDKLRRVSEALGDDDFAELEGAIRA